MGKTCHKERQNRKIKEKEKSELYVLDAKELGLSMKQ